ncbi:hypothetical protein FIBSPDRAFT_731829 [Athelia psychrophila]|uniref:Zn(2)-C6 fungal-type domain-containing protein n=1 Tax=Athelia psychrophila TaxID=1759441 RepID=A0A166Q6Q3_9AGAM|nr:hypothetical protein FIBSPDRAFT_731829 [Fibularhizoctonia sp. CBS 109695]
MLPQARNAKASTHTSAKLTTAEAAAKKRARGEITCAECKRLKLKCDKKLPCSSCVRRGCSSICPQGSFTSGRGSRFIFTDTEHLHEKISQMSQRIRYLEEALAMFQSGVSTQPHPLLRDELLLIKFAPPPRQAESKEPPSDSEDMLAETIDAFGTLAIGNSGESRYFGRSGGSESLLMAGAEEDVPSVQKDSVPPVMPDLINRLGLIFPMGVGRSNDSQKFTEAITMLFECLPPTPRAWSLLEAYMENASWLFQPAKREHLIEDFLTPIYNAKKEHDDPAVNARVQISPHKLAVLFLVMAIGANVDFTLPPQNDEAERYYHYALAALALRCIFDSPLMETVQAILLLSHYRSTAGERHSRDGGWALIGLGCKLAQSVNRDPARWNMDENTANKRRRLFWELYSIDMFTSLAMGRPPSIELSYVDCTFPQDRTEAEAQFWNWKYMFTKNVFGSVIKLTLAADPPSYKTILELDRKVREKTLPPHLLPPTLKPKTGTDDDEFSANAYLQSNLLSQFRTQTMLYLHKSFFAQALMDYPENPLLSRYAPSFLAVSTCASTIIRTSVQHYEKVPEFCLRLWTMWSHLFSAAIIVGSIVTRAPSSNTASMAYLELGIAVSLFAKGAEDSPRARGAMAILVQLQAKASALFNQFHDGSHLPSPGPDLINDQGVAVDELAIFGGQTRVLFSKKLLQRRPNSDGPGRPTFYGGSENTLIPSTHPSSKSQSSVNQEQEDASMQCQDVHPSLMEYMSMLSSTTGDGTVASPHFMEQSGASEITGPSQFSAGPPQFSAGLPNSEFFPPQPLAEYSMRQADLTQNTPTRDFTYDPNLFGPFEQFYREAASAPSAPANMLEANDIRLRDPNAVANISDSRAYGVTDDRWMSYAR